MEEGKALRKKILKDQDKLAPYQVTFAPERETAIEDQPPRAPGVIDEQFPTDKFAVKHDKEEELWATKLQLQGKDGAAPGITPFGIQEARDSDFERLLQKQALQEEANFEGWFAKWFDYASPAQKKRAKELFPSFYAQRKRLLKKQSKNVYDIARIKLMGIESEKDLRKQYELETGRLDVGPLNYLLNPERNPDASEASGSLQSQKFVRGSWSPFRVFGDEAVGARTDNETDIRLASADAYGKRTWPANQFTVGTTEGFPPMGSVAQNQGAEDWYVVLQRSLGQ